MSQCVTYNLISCFDTPKENRKINHTLTDAFAGGTSIVKENKVSNNYALLRKSWRETDVQ